MPAPLTRRLLLVAAFAFSGSASAQWGLRAAERDRPGLDPSLAGGWLLPTYDQFGFAVQPWRDGLAAPAVRRSYWSRELGPRGNFGMSYRSAGEADFDRPLSLFGRYWLSADWAVSAESMSRDAGGLLRLQDLRIGVQRRF